MIRGVTGHKLIQQRRRDVGVQPCHKACAGTDEVRLNVLETGCTVAPKRIRNNRAPRIVDIPERKAVLVVDVVIDANQLFAPGGWCRYSLLECGKRGGAEGKPRRCLRDQPKQRLPNPCWCNRIPRKSIEGTGSRASRS